MRYQLFLPALALTSSLASADVFDESLLGDFSNDRFAPTFLDFQQGTNTVLNTVFNSNNQSSGDRDYYTFTLVEGEAIDAVTVISSTNLNDGRDSTTFFGFAFGNVFDFDPDAQQGPGLAGFVLTNSFGIGRNVLPDISGGLDLLGPGDYTIWSQQTGPDPTRVQVEFNVVPTPGTGALLAAASLIATRRRR
jgi:hypothetical protein